MKLKAFTLLEIMISLLISGIVISAVYSGYVFTHQQFLKFTGIKTEIRNYFELSEVLNREFENAKKVTTKRNREIEIELINKTINYSFETDYIVREIIKENQTDTFFFAVSDVEINVINTSTSEPLVDYVKLTLKDNENEKSISLYKQYGALARIAE